MGNELRRPSSHCQWPTAAGEISSPENSVVVFPNPTSGAISLNFNDLKTPGDFQVQIFDAKGSLVFQKEKVGAALEIGGLARGVYFLNIKFEKGEISRKIVVE